MLAILPFCGADKAAAIRLTEWIEELGGVSRHECMIVMQEGQNPNGVIEPLKRAFARVYVLPCYDEKPGWPQGANVLWQTTVQVLCAARQTLKPTKPGEVRLKTRPYPDAQPFLWLEPDAIPLRASWLDDIEKEYAECEANGKAFMGDEVNASTADDPSVSLHMSGIAVYPAKVISYTNKFNQLDREAFDTFFSNDFLRATQFTKLVHHRFWESRNPQVAPLFETEADLAKIRPEAVIYHRVKDSARLIEMLRKKCGIDKSGSSHGDHTPAYVAGSNPAPATIYCYYEAAEKIDAAEQLKLIEIWKSEWRAHGWNPVVLHESDAQRHPLFNRAKATFAQFPSVNPVGYDLGCWLRWLAVSACGGGWMSDYDVLPLDMSHVNSKGLTFFSGNANDPNIPCLVYGEKCDYDALITFFLLSTHDDLHHSDMVALRTLDIPFTNLLNVKEYGEPGWAAGVAIHYSTHSMTKANQMPKSRFIGGPRNIPAVPAPVAQVDPEKEAMRAELEKLRAQVRLPLAAAALKRGRPMKTSPKSKETREQMLARMARVRAGRKSKSLATT